MRTNTCTTIRPSSRSNGTGPARGYSRAGVTEVSGRRPGAGPSASEQTGEGTASTRRRRRRQIRPAETRLSARNRLRNPVPQGAGLFYGCGGTRRRPGGRRGRLFGSRGTGRGPAGRGGRLRQTATPPQRTTPQPQSAAPQPSQSFSVSAERRKVSGRPGGTRPGERSARGRIGHLGCLGQLGYLGDPGDPGDLGDPGHLGYIGYLGTLGERGATGTFGRRVFRAVEAVSRGPAENAIIAQNDQKRPSKNRTTTTSAQMR